MESLKELIGQEVYVKQYIYNTDTDTEEIELITAKVESVYINDYYFHTKGENIYIEICLKPLEDLEKYGLEEDCLINVPLDCIYKLN